MSQTITTVIKDEVATYVDKFAEKYHKSEDEVLNELIMSGFEQNIFSLYKQYQAGEISLSWLGQELGLDLREIYELLEARNLPLSADIRLNHK